MYTHIWEPAAGECCRHNPTYGSGRFPLAAMWEMGGRKQRGSPSQERGASGETRAVGVKRRCQIWAAFKS